jgi:AhpD family alkylhydroperoxidase
MADEFKYLDSKTLELVGIGAAMAGNCLPCLTYHLEFAKRCAWAEWLNIVRLRISSNWQKNF